jgi:hypothetical protein
LDIVVSVHCEHSLPQIIGALAAARGFSCRLDSRKQECDQNAHDRDHDQQFHERKPGTAPVRQTNSYSWHVTLLASYAPMGVDLPIEGAASISCSPMRRKKHHAVVKKTPVYL